MKKDNTRLKKFVKKKVETSFWYGYLLASVAAVIAVAVTAYKQAKEVPIKPNPEIQVADQNVDRFKDSVIKNLYYPKQAQQFIDSANKYSIIYNTLTK